jgi:hypothetical protein
MLVRYKDNLTNRLLKKTLPPRSARQQKWLGRCLASPITTTILFEIFWMLLGTNLICWKNSYSKNGMNIVTKLLGSLRASCLCRPCSSSRNLTKLLRSIRDEWFYHWRNVDARWMAIA